MSIYSYVHPAVNSLGAKSRRRLEFSQMPISTHRQALVSGKGAMELEGRLESYSSHVLLLKTKDFIMHIHYARLVKTETGGSVRQHVGVHRIGNVGLPICDRSLLCSEGLENATQPGKHRKAAML